MRDIGIAFGTFGIALCVGFLVQGMYLLNGAEMATAGAAGTATLIVTGILISQRKTGRKWIDRPGN